MFETLIGRAPSRTAILAVYEVVTTLLSSRSFSSGPNDSVVATQSAEASALAAAILQDARPDVAKGDTALPIANRDALVVQLSLALQMNLLQSGAMGNRSGKALLVSLREKFKAPEHTAEGEELAESQQVSFGEAPIRSSDELGLSSDMPRTWGDAPSEARSAPRQRSSTLITEPPDRKSRPNSSDSETPWGDAYEADTDAFTSEFTTDGLSVSDAARLESGSPLAAGSRVGPYEVINLLGAGGMGHVYSAWDLGRRVPIALKVIGSGRDRSHDAEKRLLREARSTAQVSHRSIVRILDVGEIDGIRYVTMPLISGNDLGKVLRRDGKLSITRALHVARQIAEGMEALHEAGIVHRDLKPSNIMLADGDHALITDFGVAGLHDRAETVAVGTLEYMAPEQSKGYQVDRRTDIYAFGLILYEMLTGLRPRFSSLQRIDAMRHRISEGLPSIRTIDPSIPEALDAFVVRCLERDPAARFQTMAEVSADLATLDEGGERARTRRAFWNWFRRGKSR